MQGEGVEWGMKWQGNGLRWCDMAVGCQRQWSDGCIMDEERKWCGG